MKNKKFKLFASLTSLVMVVAVMAVGVWAATSASVHLKGTVGFTATGFTATLNGTVAGAGSVDPMTEAAIGGANTVAIPEWTLNGLTFADPSVDIVITLTLSDIVVATGYEVQATVTGLPQSVANMTATSNTQTVESNLVTTITFHVETPTASVATTNFDITVQYQAVEE